MLRHLRRPEVVRILILFGLVLLAAQVMVVAYYWDLGPERLRFEMMMTAIISLTAGIPAVAFLVYQNVALSAANERLAHLSSTDQMTRLLNRQSFIRQLDDHLLDHGRHMSAGVMAYIDADHFKAINDRFGHAFGDKVIVFLADRIRQATRPGDLCARLGGEEFGIFLKHASHEESAAMAENLRREIELAGLTLNIPGQPISVSIGLAAHKPGLEAVDIMREADRSLYAAKHGGRNAVVIELKHYRAA